MIEKLFWGNYDRPADARGELQGFPDQERLIWRNGNAVFFNGPVWFGSIARLMNLTREVMANKAADSRPDYALYINSPGGYVTEMFRFLDFFESEVVPATRTQTSIIHGSAASAASIIACSFEQRHITKRSIIMIHEMSAGSGGNYTSMETFQHVMDLHMAEIVKVYRHATKRSEAQIRKDLLRNKWMSAQEALEYGLVQKVL